MNLSPGVRPDGPDVAAVDPVGRAGPALDNWSVSGEDGRTVAGAEAGLALQLPAGPVVLENVLGFGWSAGPFRAAELPAGYRRQRLRAVTVGIGIRFGL